MDITIDKGDALLLLNDLCMADTPVTMSVIEMHDDAGQYIAELYVQHETEGVPDFRIHLKPDGTWAPILRIHLGQE